MHSTPPTPQTLLEGAAMWALLESILSSGTLARFIGLVENEVFEAKGSAAYPLDTAGNRYELAKDVVAFANANGGLIAVGVRTRPDPVHEIDTVYELDLVTEPAFKAAQILGVIKEHVYPKVTGLQVQWVSNNEDKSLGVGIVRIPAQSEEAKPFIITRVVEGSEPVRPIVVGYAIRKGANSEPITAIEMQQALRNGMSPNAQRLTRIEQKLDTLLDRKIDRQATPEEDRVSTRIEDLLRDA